MVTDNDKDKHAVFSHNFSQKEQGNFKKSVEFLQQLKDFKDWFKLEKNFKQNE